MKTYYAVGQAIQIVEQASLIEGIYHSGFARFGLGARKPRIITEAVIKNEAFPSGKITLIFSNYEDAKKYAEALRGEVYYVDTWPYQSGAPILIFETDKLDEISPKEENIKNTIKSEEQKNQKETIAYDDQRYYNWTFRGKDIFEKVLDQPLRLSVISAELDVNEVSFIRVEFPVVQFAITTTQAVDFKAPAASATSGNCMFM